MDTLGLRAGMGAALAALLLLPACGKGPDESSVRVSPGTGLHGGMAGTMAATTGTIGSRNRMGAGPAALDASPSTTPGNAVGQR